MQSLLEVYVHQTCRGKCGTMGTNLHERLHLGNLGFCTQTSKNDLGQTWGRCDYTNLGIFWGQTWGNGERWGQTSGKSGDKPGELGNDGHKPRDFLGTQAWGRIWGGLLLEVCVIAPRSDYTNLQERLHRARGLCTQTFKERLCNRSKERLHKPRMFTQTSKNVYTNLQVIDYTNLGGLCTQTLQGTITQTSKSDYTELEVCVHKRSRNDYTNRQDRLHKPRIFTGTSKNDYTEPRICVHKPPRTITQTSKSVNTIAPRSDNTNLGCLHRAPRTFTQTSK